MAVFKLAEFELIQTQLQAAIPEPASAIIENDRSRLTGGQFGNKPLLSLGTMPICQSGD